MTFFCIRGIVDSHVIVRNNAKLSCVPSGSILQNHSLAHYPSQDTDSPVKTWNTPTLWLSRVAS